MAANFRGWWLAVKARLLWLGGASEIQVESSRQLQEILSRDEPTPSERILGAVRSFFTLCADPNNDGVVTAAIESQSTNEEVADALNALRNEIRAMGDAGSSLPLRLLWR